MSIYSLMDRQSCHKRVPPKGIPLPWRCMPSAQFLFNINRLSGESVKQALYADDASAAGDIHSLRHWWDHLIQLGPDYGYYPNAPKTWLIVKEKILPLAETIFEGSGVSVTKEGK